MTASRPMLRVTGWARRMVLVMVEGFRAGELRRVRLLACMGMFAGAD